MSFTVVVKDNEDGKVYFASENVTALVLGVVDKNEKDGKSGSLAFQRGSMFDMMMALAFAKKAIESVEKKDPIIKTLSPILSTLLDKEESKDET